MLKDFLIAISMANLWFVDIWRPFLIRHFTSYPYYHWKANPAPILMATMLDVLLLSTILWLAITIARRSRRPFVLPVARFIFVVLFLLIAINLLLIAARNPPLQSLISSVIQSPSLLFKWQGRSTFYPWLALVGLLVGSVAIAIAIHSLIYRRQRLIKVSAIILLITSPFVVITFTQAATQWFRYHKGKQFLDSTAPPLSKKGVSNRRIFWVIFDEMDFRLSFIDRPDTLVLPEFDRLRQESIFAENAYPPGGDTETSLPGLINGRRFSRVSRVSPNELMLVNDANDKVEPWSTLPNVFSRARTMNLNTELIGWYHPYCRVIGSSLTRCSWEPASLLLLRNSQISDLISSSKNATVFRSMLRVAGSLLFPEIVRIVIPGESPDVWRYHFLQEFKSIHQKSLAAAIDPTLDLVLVHYPIPHPPGFYDRYKDDFSFSSNSAYLDNLSLADRVVRELRSQMVQANMWDSTTILISSDHRLRADLWRVHPFWKPSFTNEVTLVRNSSRDDRVPFILKLAGENQGLVYQPEFDTVLSQDLLLAVLSGEISTHQGAIGWLNRQQRVQETPSNSEKQSILK